MDHVADPGRRGAREQPLLDVPVQEDGGGPECHGAANVVEQDLGQVSVAYGAEALGEVPSVARRRPRQAEWPVRLR